MAHSPEKKVAARAAYAHEALTLEVIAQRLGISVGTLSRWKREAAADGDDWDRARAAARLSSQGAEAVTSAVLEDFVMLFQSTISEVKADPSIKAIVKAEIISRLSDAYNKTMAAVAKGSPKLNKLAIAMEVMQHLVEFIREEYPHLAEGFMEMLEPFGKRLAKALG